MKLLGNMLILESIQVFSEIYALADATGVNAGKLHEMFRKHSLRCPLELRQSRN